MSASSAAYSIALFNSAYIYDQFLHNIKEAVAIYYKIQEDYESHTKIDYVNNRLTELDSNISGLISENSQKISLYEAYDLIKSDNLDSAKTKFENIEINRREPVFQTARDLTRYLESYISMQKEYKSKAEDLKDSLIFHMAEIDYYYFDKSDEALLKFENIVQKNPKSKYYNQSLWILGNNFDKYKQDSIQYSLIDTSDIFFHNPIRDWDIKKIKNEYEELNNLYDNFKRKMTEDEN